MPFNWRLEMTRREKIGTLTFFVGIVCFGFGRAFGYVSLTGIGLIITFVTAIVSGLVMGLKGDDK